MNHLPPLDLVLAKLATAGVKVPAGRLRIDAYGDSPEVSDELLELIRSGPKRAGTSLLWACEHDGDVLPEVGDVEIVVDHSNDPVLLTRLIRVEILPFNEVSAEYAKIEGEGDGSLDYWRKEHWLFFAKECSRIGREPRENMPVVCSVFELLACVPRGAA